MIENNNLIISVDGPAGSGKERIAKYISNAGVCSRREAEKLIVQKKVYILYMYNIYHIHTGDAPHSSSTT